jgi:MYXO-CTERM domain-containing protein
MYRDAGWPYASSAATLALTTVTYNVNTGEIFDAEVEINSADNPITVGDDSVQFDLDSIITHESGHFLGLAHSCDLEATMFVSYKLGDTSLRSLEADDIAGICSIYPPGTSVAQCDPTPRHGFSSDCGSPPAETGCCTTAPGGPSRSGSAAVLALLAAFGLGASRRRRRR